MSTEKLGYYIRSLRELKSFSRELVASELGVITSTIARWELGYCSPPELYLAKIASILEVTVQELRTGTYATKEQLAGATVDLPIYSYVPKELSLQDDAYSFNLNTFELVLSERKVLYPSAMFSVKNLGKRSHYSIEKYCFVLEVNKKCYVLQSKLVWLNIFVKDPNKKYLLAPCTSLKSYFKDNSFQEVNLAWYTGEYHIRRCDAGMDIPLGNDLPTFVLGSIVYSELLG